MKCLTTALFFVLLSTIAFAKPMGRRRHHGANHADNDLTRRGPNRTRLGSWRPRDWSSESSSRESSESSESQSSEESTEVTATRVTTTDGSTFTSEPNTLITDGRVDLSTPPAATRAPPVPGTSPGCVTQCFTKDIATNVPITENRGDN
ncbi:uncharacterized protein ACO6RY_06320 [Pungitius sinensis]